MARSRDADAAMIGQLSDADRPISDAPEGRRSDSGWLVTDSDAEEDTNWLWRWDSDVCKCSVTDGRGAEQEYNTSLQQSLNQACQAAMFALAAREGDRSASQGS